VGKLLQRLQNAAESGVYRTRSVDALDDALQGSRLDFARIVLDGVSGKPALMARFAGTLGFPAGFGENWDALEDCLTDLSWRSAEGHVIAFEAFESLPNEDLGMLMQVLEAAAGFWGGGGKPFFAVFVDPARRLVLPDLFDQA
jgi:RNAse (barnase) inhibitor barstar